MNYQALYDLKIEDLINYIEGCTQNLQNQILSNKIIQEKLSNNIDDPDEYRFLISKLEKSIEIKNIESIESCRKKNYRNIINDYNKEYQMFEKYKKINNILNDNYEPLIDLFELMNKEELRLLPNKAQHDIQVIFYNQKLTIEQKKKKISNLFKNISAKQYLKITIDYYFKDITFNFMKNVETLINFNKETNIIKEDNIKLYKKLLEMYEKNYIDTKLLEKLDENKNYMEVFYDDFSNSKKLSYNMINDALFDINNISEQLNKNLSDKYNVPIYEFNGQPFYALIHNTSVYKNGDYTSDIVFSGSSFDATSMSLISNERIKTYNSFQPSIIVGFNNIDANNIVHLYNSDSFSSFLKHDDSLPTKRVCKLFTPKSLIKNTKGYNEILYQCRQNNVNENALENILKPSYVLCFNDIAPLDIEVAHKFNIPVINIDKTKYINQLPRTIIDTDSAKDSYIESYSEIKNKSK